jgi:outer membrane protein TolC
MATARQVLDAETDLLQAREGRIAAQIEHRRARYEVLRATALLVDRFALPPTPPPLAAAAPPETK